jgi:hypothetical protein
MGGLNFENVGWFVGGLAGGVGNGLAQGAKGAVVGGGVGALAGAATGAIVGVPTGPGEILTIPSGAAVGAVGGAVVGGAYGAVDGVSKGVPVGADYGASAGKWLDQKIAQMTGADDAAEQTGAKTGATAITCATCAQNPCAALACGNRGSKYRGGAHGCMTGTDETKGDALDSHHMPARSISPLHPDVGPAIQMDPRDHRMTNSYGRSAATNATLASQQEMIASGNFIIAQGIDVAEVKAKFPGKYDSAIDQMEVYTACLKANKII